MHDLLLRNAVNIVASVSDEVKVQVPALEGLAVSTQEDNRGREGKWWQG